MWTFDCCICLGFRRIQFWGFFFVFRVTRFRITNYLATETEVAPSVLEIISTPSSKPGRITASVPYQSTAKLTSLLS